ncbi:MAG TPA: hypothetical protein VNC78_03240 [Actinomycetota bacterium]|nr:hypothetical protein [Actinomycetota bacterium]
MSNSPRIRPQVIGSALIAIAVLVALFATPIASAQTPVPGGTATASPEPAPTSAGAADLAISMTAPSSTPLVGDSFQVTLGASNRGPDAAPDTTVGMFFGEGVEFISATSSDATDSCSFGGSEYPPGSPSPAEGDAPSTMPVREGGGVSCSLGTLASGAATNLTLSLRRTRAQELWLSSSIYSRAEDVVYDNNYRDVQIAADTSNPSDVAVTLTAPRKPEVGTTFDLAITVTNNGPASASGVVVNDYLPDGVDLRSVSSSDSSDACTQPSSSSPAPAGSPEFYAAREVRCDLGTMAPGSSSRIVISVERTRAYEMYNSAYATTTSYDGEGANNSADARILADDSNPADVSISVSAPRRPALEQEFDYTIEVANNGPARARNVVVTNQIPDGVTYVSSSMRGSNGACTLFESGGPYPASEPEGGSPAFYRYRQLDCAVGDLAPGAAATITMRVRRDSPWELWNYASVSAMSFDPNTENDYDYAQTAADPSVTSDLVLTAAGPSGAPLVGERFSYTFQVTNAGPAVAEDASMSSYLPDGVTFEGVSSSSPNADCSFNDYQGDPVATQDAPAPSGKESPESGGGAAIYPDYSSNIVNCTLGSLASGASLSITINVARSSAKEQWNSASVYSSNFDPDYDNNYAEVVTAPDTTDPADLSVTIDAPARPAMDETFAYRVRVQNNGPSTARSVVVSDFLPFEVEYVGASMSPPSGECVSGGYGYGYTETKPPPPSDGGGTEPQPAPAESGSTEPQPAPAEDSSRPYGGGELRCDLGDVASGATATITIDVIRRSEYEIWNSAYATTSNYDPDVENDYASHLVEGKAYPYPCSGTAGTRGDDVIVIDDCPVAAGAGDDSVEVAAGSKTGDTRVSAGDGSDDIVVNLNAAAITRRRIEIHGGRGADRISIAAAPGAGERTIVIFGDRGNDTIDVDVAAGTDLRIVVRGGAGNDTARVLTTRGSADGVPGVSFSGGEGSDVLLGGSGRDVMRGHRGRDRIDARAGNDLIDGGAGLDECRGGPGRDSITDC